MGEFADMLRKCRLNAGMKQKDLALATGVSGAYITKLEKGGFAPSSQFLEKLASVLEADPLALFLAGQSEINMPLAILAPLKDLARQMSVLEQEPDIMELFRIYSNLGAEKKLLASQLIVALKNLLAEPEITGISLSDKLD